MWRRGRDSNPRYGITVYTLSRRAPSATRTPLQFVTSFRLHRKQHPCGAPSSASCLACVALPLSTGQRLPTYPLGHLSSLLLLLPASQATSLWRTRLGFLPRVRRTSFVHWTKASDLPTRTPLQFVTSFCLHRKQHPCDIPGLDKSAGCSESNPSEIRRRRVNYFAI